MILSHNILSTVGIVRMVTTMYSSPSLDPRIYRKSLLSSSQLRMIVTMNPPMADNRTEDDLTFCPRPGGCIIYSRTVPYVVIYELHQSKMDANRDQPEATFNDTIAMGAWDAFHNFILYAQERIQSQFGTIMNEKGVEGIRGLLFDVHGYAGIPLMVDCSHNGDTTSARIH